MKRPAVVELKTPMLREDALRVVDAWVSIDNELRLFSGIGYVTPGAKLLDNAKLESTNDEGWSRLVERASSPCSCLMESWDMPD